jgi:predicted AAA+ superfamily ATPase
MATTNLRIGSLGDIPIITGIGNPNHQSIKDTIYKDRNTGFLYRNTNGLTNWEFIGSAYAFLIMSLSGTTSGSTVNKFVTNVGDNVSTTINVNHNLNSEDVIVQVFRNSSPKDTVFCDIERVDNNNIQLIFANPPTTNEYRVIII